MADDRHQSLQGSTARSGCAGRKPGDESHKKGFNTKLHSAVDAHGMPVRIIAAEGTRADCAEAASLIEGIDAEPLIADKGDDSDAIIRQARSQGMQAQIPPRKNRKEPRDYDKPLYRQRHPVENAFLHLKGWRGIGTRYAKNLASFLAAAQIRCLALWLRIS
ncbi:MAG: IS5 family transposase [Burkholderiales bacterium]